MKCRWRAAVGGSDFQKGEKLLECVASSASLFESTLREPARFVCTTFRYVFKGTSRRARYRHKMARVTLDYTFRHYGEYFIACLSYGVPLVNRKVPGVRRAQI
jgi:hypothetical protein